MKTSPGRIVGLSLMLCAAMVGVPHLVFAEATSLIPIRGTVLDAQDQPVSDILVRSIVHDQTSETRTDDEGKFTILANAERIGQMAIIADDVAGKRMGLYLARRSNPPKANEQVTVRLEPSRELAVEVKDAEGNPSPTTIVGMLVGQAAVTTTLTNEEGQGTLRWPHKSRPTHLYAFRPHVGFDYRAIRGRTDPTHEADWLSHPPATLQLAPSRPIELHVVDRHSQPLAGVMLYPWLLQKPGEPDHFNLGFTPTFFPESTGEEGIATFEGLPQWNERALIFFPGSDQYSHKQIPYDAQEHPDGQMTVTLDRLVPVSGRVVFSDGRPVADVTVAAQGSAYDHQRESSRVKTDATGKFEMQLPPDFLYSFAVESERWGSPLLQGIVVEPDKPLSQLKLTVVPATRIFGRVTVDGSAAPVAGQRLTLSRLASDLRVLPGIRLPNPTGSSESIAPFHQSIAETDADGNYEFLTGEGEFILEGPLPFESKRIHLAAGHGQEFNFTVPDQEQSRLKGSVVTGDPPQPIGNVIVEGRYAVKLPVVDAKFETDAKGNFSGQRYVQPIVLYARTQDGKLAGILQVGPDQSDVTLAISPVGSAKGRLVDAKTKAPLKDIPVKWGYKIQFNDRLQSATMVWSQTTKTDNEGRFELSEMVVGKEYHVYIPMDESRWRQIDQLIPVRAETEDLGDLPVSIRR